ncbi:nuclear transport factor 2 family protein [Pedobacter sandarakinus]|uniref:nuclear transport factor 2 family protein n=1 Tax=Pedobacter sandarakinus TaxID=353156 RepID=UPI002247A5AE|nr:nuclear transport factor 2 family protein [Pedobacter sandarakinus]MCX2573498.1 nuclear transport factor 2 family protein [Pedobacter sandarakinus]
MKKPVLFVLFWVGMCVNLFAQDEEKEIKMVVNNLFAGMKSGDSTLARSAFAKDCIFQTVGNKDGKTVVRNESLDGFIKLIGSPHPQKFDERIVFTKILVDGPLASVWTDYKFYVDEKFSHCGVNSFQLVKGEGGWQIVYLIDTRRKDDCKF